MTRESAHGRRRFLATIAAGALGSGVGIGRGSSAVSAWTGRDTNSVLNQARPTDREELTIARVDPYVMRFGRDEQGQPRGIFYLLCRVETADGYVGWGEGTNFPKVAPIAAEIEMVRPLVIGQSAWNIEKIWYTLYRGRNAMHGSVVQSAISAIDIALWDIVGKKLNVPVYRLLGGKINDRLKIYTSGKWGNIPRTAEAYAQKTKELITKGATAGKWDPFYPDPKEITVAPTDYSLSRQATLKTIHEVTDMVRGIREGGPDFEICVEAHAKFNVDSAIRICKALEPYQPYFVEEPVPPENVDAMLRVQESTSIPIAAGERLKSRLQAREYLERGAFRVYQPDVARTGGITEFRKAVAVAEDHFIPVAPHNPNGVVCLAAHLHLSTACANFLILEQGGTNPVLCREVFGAWEDSWSHFRVPERPGTGIRFSDDFIKQHSVDLKTAERETQ